MLLGMFFPGTATQPTTLRTLSHFEDYNRNRVIRVALTVVVLLSLPVSILQQIRWIRDVAQQDPANSSYAQQRSLKAADAAPPLEAETRLLNNQAVNNLGTPGTLTDPFQEEETRLLNNQAVNNLGTPGTLTDPPQEAETRLLNNNQAVNNLGSSQQFLDYTARSIAFCITGQTSRLELDSKIEHIFASNGQRTIVHVFFNLDNSPDTNFVFADGDIQASPYAKWNQEELKQYVSLRMRTLIMKQQQQQQGKSPMHNNDRSLLPAHVHGVHVNFYRQSLMNFDIDHRWVSHLNEIDGSVDPSLTLQQNLEKRSILYTNQFSSISMCMEQVEAYETASGNRFDLVARVRDDAYAMDDWILDDSYYLNHGMTALDCQQWGGLHDMTYVVNRVHASAMFRNLLSWRLERRKLVQNVNGKNARFPNNPERWLLAVVRALDIPVHRVSVCDMPLVMVRFTKGGLIVKDNVGDHILAGAYQHKLGLHDCDDMSFPPFSKPEDPIRQYDERKMINLEGAVNDYHDKVSNKKYGRVESKTYFIWGQQCSSCQPNWAKKLLQMTTNPFWDFLQQPKMRCFPSSPSVCNDKQQSERVDCFQQQNQQQQQQQIKQDNDDVNQSKTQSNNNNNNHILLPSVQIIGAQKAGTTTIAEWLLDGGFRRPQVFEGEPVHYRKEVHFFDLKHRYERGLEFYAKRFQNSESGKALDATPDTFQFPDRVHSTYKLAGLEQLKSLKIIIILREPVERELSLYSHRVIDSQNLPPSQQNAWHREVLKPDGAFMTLDEYLKTVSIPALEATQCFDDPDKCGKGQSSRHGLYAFYLSKWFELFNRQRQILVLSFDELSNDPHAVQHRIESFLGRAIPGNLLKQNSHTNMTNKSSQIVASDATMQRLELILAPHNKQLYQLLDTYPGPPMEQRPFPNFYYTSNRPKVDFEEASTMDMPCGDGNGNVVDCPPGDDDSSMMLRLVVKYSNHAAESVFHSESTGKYTVQLLIQPTVMIKTGCPGCNLYFVNEVTGKRINVDGVLHWAWAGHRLYFQLPHDGGTSAADFNAIFSAGDTIMVQHRNGDKGGMRKEDYKVGVDAETIDAP